YFIVALCKNLKQLFEENFEINQESLDTITFYRGLKLSQNDIEQLKQSTGKYISTNGYLSTSFYRHIAELFSVNTLFKITVNTKLKNIIYADISKHSMIYDEQKVLFDLGSVFQISDITYEQNKLIVSMIGVNDVECLKNDYRQWLEENTNNPTYGVFLYPDLLFGQCLTRMGHSKKSVQ
ncbi:unnamed protein product, partial [Didymodactylos carnosus]